jgi:hypothetical protein
MNSPEMRIRTLVALVRSMASIMGGDELNFADTGDEVRKETAEFARLWASLEAIFLPEEIEDEAHLQDLTVGLETAPIGGEPKWPGN